MGFNVRILIQGITKMLKKTIFLGLVALIFVTVHRESEAQQVIKTLQDYCLNPFRQFQPDDPWTRSCLWNLQAGRSGLFFNCDEEEQKRYSPYIYWKCQTIDPIPPCPLAPRYLISDLHATKQRIIDGSCGCQCTFAHCAGNCGGTCAASLGPISCNCPSRCPSGCTNGCTNGCNSCTTTQPIPNDQVTPIPTPQTEPPHPPVPQASPVSPVSEPVTLSSKPVATQPQQEFGRRFVAREGLISVRPHQRPRPNQKMAPTERISAVPSQGSSPSRQQR